MTRLYIQDITLRDGMHAFRHQYDLGCVRDIAQALDETGVDTIEVAHSDGLEGLTFNYGFGRCLHEVWIVETAKACRRARLMASYGAGCVYVTDSGGRLTMRGVRERYEAYRQILQGCTERGATRVDSSLTGMGTGAGNCPIEAFIAMADLHGWTHGCDLFKQQDAAEELVRPPQDRHVRIDRETLMLSYAGAYSSFLHHDKQAAELHELDTRDILIKFDRRKMVGSPEDMIINVVLDVVRGRAGDIKAGEGEKAAEE